MKYLNNKVDNKNNNIIDKIYIILDNAIINKMISLIITLLVISFVTFILFTIIPGDTAVYKLGTEATQETIEALREELGLNKPITTRYFNWLSNAVKGDLGMSSQYKQPVTNLLQERLLVTVSLAVISLIIIVIISTPLGIISAKKEGGLIDRVISIMSQITMAVPPFFLGMIITLIFGLILKWFVPGGYIDIKKDFLIGAYYLMYPAFAIALPKSAMLIKFLRSSVINQYGQDYVRTAYSKGNKKNTVMYRHILKNALIPVLTFFATQVAEVLAGSIVVEQVFGIPGLGRLMVVSISNRDFNVVQGIVLYISAMVMFVNFVVDILYQFIDPRVSAV